MLRVENINVSYGDVRVLYDVSLEINEGEVVALVGANAAGKTTTLKTISGIIRPSTGKILFKGEDITTLNSFEIVEKGVIHVPEGRRLFPRMTVEDNLLLGSYTKSSRSSSEQTMKEIYEIFPVLYERKNQLAGALSGGEQQMCAIARGLMSKPEILMLDEISLGLSPILVKHALKTIKEINNKGTTILIIDQNVNYALQISDKGYVIENGRIVMKGDGKTLLEDSHLKKAYLGM